MRLMMFWRCQNDAVRFALNDAMFATHARRHIIAEGCIITVGNIICQRQISLKKASLMTCFFLGAGGGTCYEANKLASTRPRARQPFTERLPFCKQNRPVQVPPILTKNKRDTALGISFIWCRWWDLNPHAVASNGF